MALHLVTGGAGFIGSHIVDALLARGHDVRVLDDLSSGHLENIAGNLDRIQFIEGDIRDRSLVRRAVADVACIFHLAAMVSVPQSMEQPGEAELINVVGTLNLLEAARAAGARRLVLSSTCAVYGDDPTLPKTELMPAEPKSPYAISKLATEFYCRLFTDAFDLETVVLRYFNIFGPRQDPSSPYSGVISIFVDRMSHSLPVTIYGDGEQTRDFVFVNDVVQANLLAAESSTAVGQIFNIGTGQAVTINRLAESLARILEYDQQPIHKPARPGDIVHSYAAPSLARDVLNWNPQISFQEGLRALVESVGKTFHT